MGFASTPMELVHLSRAIPQPTLGASLRAARLGRNITIEAVAARTKLNPGFFRDLERDDLSKWPANQFYRESYLRGYAEAVGLDPADVIDAFRREFVPAGTSGATGTATQRRVTPVTIPIIIAITFVTLYSLARWTPAGQNDPASGVTAPARAAGTGRIIDSITERSRVAGARRVAGGGACDGRSRSNRG